MPAEFEPQQGVWMLWPERNDNWRGGGKPALCQGSIARGDLQEVKQFLETTEI